MGTEIASGEGGENASFPLSRECEFDNPYLCTTCLFDCLRHAKVLLIYIYFLLVKMSYNELYKADYIRRKSSYTSPYRVYRLSDSTWSWQMKMLGCLLSRLNKYPLLSFFQRWSCTLTFSCHSVCCIISASNILDIFLHWSFSILMEQFFSSKWSIF